MGMASVSRIIFLPHGVASAAPVVGTEREVELVLQLLHLEWSLSMALRFW